MSAHVCDGIDKVTAAIGREDWGTLIGATLHAAFSGDRCACTQPLLTGADLMCGCCLLENDGQIRDLERRMAEPHAFVEGEHSDIGMCGLCTGWRDDARHEPTS